MDSEVMFWKALLNILNFISVVVLAFTAPWWLF